MISEIYPHAHCKNFSWNQVTDALCAEDGEIYFHFKNISWKQFTKKIEISFTIFQWENVHSDVQFILTRF